MKMFTLSFLLVTHFSFISTANHSSFGKYGTYNIVLKSFLATVDGKSARLSWDFAEMDHDVTCNLERSEDGIRFTSIQTFNVTQGFRGTMRTLDKNLKPGQYYYRLNISKPGFIPYISGIVSIRVNAETETNTSAGFQVMNPFRDQLTVRGKFGSKQLRVEVSDMNGRVRIVRTIESYRNNDRITLSTGNLDKGAYIIRIKEGNAGEEKLIMTRRVIKND